MYVAFYVCFVYIISTGTLPIISTISILFLFLFLLPDVNQQIHPPAKIVVHSILRSLHERVKIL